MAAMFRSISRQRRLFGIILSISLVYLLYISTYTNVRNTSSLKPKIDHSKFNIEDYTYPLPFNIKDVVERHLYNKIPLPSQYVNPHPYRYHYSPSPCNFTCSPEPFILVLVKSFVGNIDQRVALRKQASNFTTRSNIKFFFMLGHVDKYADKVYQENKTFGDVIQEDFVDAYSNNTLKTIMGFNWAVQYCSEAHLLVFLDDDFFVRWNKMLDFLYTFRQNHTNLFFGRLVTAAKPYRNTGSPWHVDPYVYPYDRYPPYLAGGSYVVSNDVSKKFKMAFPYVRYIGIDDAYLGIVAKILSISPTHCTALTRTDNFGIVKECSRVHSKSFNVKCEINARASISLKVFVTEVETVLRKFIGVLINIIMLIQKILMILQYVVTFGQQE